MQLTHQQYFVLRAASKDKPIYAENPSMMHVQMPNQLQPHPLRTVQSLVKRGLLAADGKGGFLITNAGIDAIQS